MIQINNEDTAEQSTPQVNNNKPTKTNSTLNNIVPFKYTVAFLTHSSFRILSRRIAPDSTPNVSNSTSRQGNINRTFKIFLVTLSTVRKVKNSIAVSKAVKRIIKVIHGIEGDAQKVKISPWKIKQPNLEFMKYIKAEK